MNGKSDFIKYANSFQAVAKLKLENIDKLTTLLDNPQDDLKFIHIAGTNGKGSVCSFLENILKDVGFVTGKYTSPNMLRVNERICVDGVEISDDDLARIMEIVQKKAEIIKEETGDIPTQFEIWTAIAFCYFKEKNCDYVVLETGLGGERDATNIIKNPVISVITQIATDHTEYLGNTIFEIATAKAGIIKESIYGGVTVTIPQDEEVLRVLKAKAKEKGNRFIVSENVNLHNFNKFYEEFDYKDLKNLKISLLGAHQAQNASLAIEASICLGIDEKHIRSGLIKAKNAGRLDIIKENPLTIFDGAHNKNGMKALSSFLKRCFPDEEICFIMGFMRDKDIDGALEELTENGYGKGNEVFTVRVSNNPRSATAEELADIVSEHGFKTTSCDNIKNAYEMASELNKIIVICGSLYLYKDYFTICWQTSFQDWHCIDEMIK